MRTQALRRSLREVQADVGTLAAAAETWAAGGPIRSASTVALLRRGLALRRALARLSRRLALECATRLAEEGAGADRTARRMLAQLLLALRRASCVRCWLQTSFDPERRRRRPPRSPAVNGDGGMNP